jgi:hypothetical protein
MSYKGAFSGPEISVEKYPISWEERKETIIKSIFINYGIFFGVFLQILPTRDKIMVS